MNILIIQEGGRNEKNKNFRESLVLSRSLNKIDGIQSKVWGLGHDNYQTESFEDLSRWTDVFFILENYNSGWLPVDKIKESKNLKIFWSIDSHYALGHHMDQCKRLCTNILLNSTEYFIPNFESISDRCYWFPNCYPSDLIQPIRIDKKIDLGFCGNVRPELEMLDRISLEENISIRKDLFVLGDDMVRSINSYKIHFNKNISIDINYRTFETCGCKTLLLTNYTPNLEKLFKINEEIVVWDNYDDLKYKVKSLLSDDSLRKSIEKRGYDRVIKDHTYDVRSYQLVEIIKNF